jgi:curved DNA-binding protein
MEFVDYYKILGIEKNATDKDIKTAYRKLARKYHPDLNPNDKDAKKKFQQINEANEVLRDPEKRRKYDQYGEHWQHGEEYENARQYQQQQQQQQQQASGSNGQSHAWTETEGDFSDFFSSMFGAAGGARSKHVKFRGEDYNAELHLNLADAYQTHKQTLTVNGKNIRITIPAGVENGQTIKISGHGGPGVNGGPNGDLYLTFSIADHPQFRRNGHNLYTTAVLDLYTAILGGELIVDTLTSKVKIKIKPETQNGTKIKLKNMGFPLYKKENQFGDLYITLSITIPTNLTDREKELFGELAKLSTEKKG